ncbi:MAG TPA: YggT family protein [Burkholderiales bacterium]|nr:YggT family protein [Burkholderiales bacterium]
MISQALIFLLDAVLEFVAIGLLLRFYLQLLRAPYRNPLAQFLNALTDWLVLPSRRFIPGLWGMDLATLVLSWLVEVVLLFCVLELRGVELHTSIGTAVPVLAALAAVRVLRLSLYILMAAAIIQAILSWMDRYNPMAPLLNSLTQPFLRPIRKRVPPVGNVDLSPLILIIAIQLILMLPVEWLERTLPRAF